MTAEQRQLGFPRFAQSKAAALAPEVGPGVVYGVMSGMSGVTVALLDAIENRHPAKGLYALDNGADPVKPEGMMNPEFSPSVAIIERAAGRTPLQIIDMPGFKARKEMDWFFAFAQAAQAQEAIRRIRLAADQRVTSLAIQP